MRFFLMGGLYMWFLLITTLMILGLSIKKTIDLYIRKNLNQYQLEWGLNSILFWGIISAILGILGQCTGIYIALGFIARAPEINPQICIEGFNISFITTITGLFILLFSSIFWFVLRSRFKKLMR